MATIGTFHKGEDGNFNGAIKTLNLNVKTVQLRKVEAESDKAPNYRIFSGQTEFGAAWNRVSKEGRDYISVKLDDPSFHGPIYASLVDAPETSEAGGYSLIWSRS
jgi:uncharacterized protein (DUF736 family)